MKIIFTVEDTPKGIHPMLEWEDNGITDHMASSISMHIAHQMVMVIKKLETLGVLKVTDDSDLH